MHGGVGEFDARPQRAALVGGNVAEVLRGDGTQWVRAQGAGLDILVPRPLPDIRGEISNKGNDSRRWCSSARKYKTTKRGMK